MRYLGIDILGNVVNLNLVAFFNSFKKVIFSNDILLLAVTFKILSISASVIDCSSRHSNPGASYLLAIDIPGSFT